MNPAPTNTNNDSAPTGASYQACVESQRAEIAALREDKARLDWFAEGDSYGKLASTRRTLPTAAYPTATACDCIRAAIDAAMKEAKP